ncbi:hypothetical protein HY772_07885, partial [Candidatus Woesearchaeota archaeon]|nr:hypothetical protein [Candidatus Woesearchaeota archaeon]
HVLPFLSETVTIPAVIIPENGQPFSTTFDRPRYLNINVQRIEDEIVVPAQEEQRQREAALLAELERKKHDAEAQAAINEDEGVEEGEIVYRVYGGEAQLYGRSWTNMNPLDAMTPVPTNPDVGWKSMYRILSGLPNANTGNCLAIGTLERTEGVGRQQAPKASNLRNAPYPDPHNYAWQKGGWPELVIPEFANVRAYVRVKPAEACIPVDF